MDKIKRTLFLHSIDYRFLCHSLLYKRHRKCNDYYVNDYSSDMFSNVYFLWN